MPRVIITINTDNAAFGENLEEQDAETARILEDLARKFRRGEPCEPDKHLRDLNGNTVGSIQFQQ